MNACVKFLNSNPHSFTSTWVAMHGCALHCPADEVAVETARMFDVQLEGILQDANVTIKAGQRVAVTGPNGAGKSTLLRLIAGIIEPDKGAVRLDGQDVGTCRWRDLRRAFAMVSPELPLLRGSLRLNVTYGATDRTDEDVRRVFDELGLNALVERLPNGLESRISESGAGLSTGERARVALARALLARPRVLLLDEADANLDGASRATLEKVIAEFPGTVLFITHDARRAAKADRILRVQAGRLSEAEPADAPDTETAPPNLRVVV